MSSVAKSERAIQFLDEAKKTLTRKGIPELFYSNSTKYNSNVPLGWSESLFIVALHEFNNRFALCRAGGVWDETQASLHSVRVFRRLQKSANGIDR
jgi:hypothetical protein